MWKLMGTLCTVSARSFVYCIYSLFLKKLKHMILAADYMKKNYSVNRAGLCTKTNHSLVLHEIFTSPDGHELFEINFEFKWKQSATKPKSAERDKSVLSIFPKKSLKYCFSKNLLTKYCKAFFKGFNYGFLGLLFKSVQQQLF